MPSRSEDRLFVRDGFRHYRRRYSAAEARWGATVGVVLVAILGWVLWRGAQASPELYSEGLVQLGAPEEADRGPLPASLAAGGWTEGKISTYGPDNVYEKINGRAGFFKSHGFQKLHAVTLTSGEDSIDIELYDQGSQENALGAYTGERAAGVESESRGGVLFHIERNALFMASGKYYLRAVGSDETEAVVAELGALRGKFAETLTGSELPWAYDFFSALGVNAGELSFESENVFSFEFATNTWIAKRKGGTELFLSLRASDEDAAAISKKLTDGFAEQGESTTSGGLTWSKDHYLGSYSTAISRERWLLGVRRAPDIGAGTASLAELQNAVKEMSPALFERAASESAKGPAAKAPATTDQNDTEGTEFPEETYE